ncbi:C4-dicarboxylate TRAP transporter substrate-binding protein [Sneathiella sp.]|uniref:C4-dicarboxylate TRAP transporter substrate-binding protein n=1 Tax=Sneathiella sp. TaxID=1964365 RepID=UPI00356A4DBB
MKYSVIKLVAMAFAAMIFTGQASAETKIVYANYLGLKHTSNPPLERFFERVEKETNGSVVWEPHFASSLLGPKDIPAGVRDGIADAGYFVGVYVPSEMPVDNYIGDFSMMNDDALAMTGVNNELILLECDECDKEYREGFNTQFLGAYALTDYVFQCKEEIKNLADMENMRVRGFSGWSDLVKAMGAIPVSISANEMYEALERGTLDCATQAITNQKTRSLGEVAHNVILNSLGGFMGGSFINMRLEKWNELNPSERTVILKNVPKLITEAMFGYIDGDIEVRKEMEAKGNKFYDADPDLAKFIKDFRTDYIKTRAVEKGKERGVKNPQIIADKIVELRAKWDKLLAENGRDRETFERLLWEQVYSKVPVN